jgi:hypothetical protein
VQNYTLNIKQTPEKAFLGTVSYKNRNNMFRGTKHEEYVMEIRKERKPVTANASMLSVTTGRKYKEGKL